MSKQHRNKKWWKNKNINIFNIYTLTNIITTAWCGNIAINTVVRWRRVCVCICVCAESYRYNLLCSTDWCRIQQSRIIHCCRYSVLRRSFCIPFGQRIVGIYRQGGIRRTPSSYTATGIKFIVTFVMQRARILPSFEISLHCCLYSCV